MQNIRISLTVPTYDGATQSKIPFWVRQISYCTTKHNIVLQFANKLITDIKWNKFCLIIMKGEAVHSHTVFYYQVHLHFKIADCQDWVMLLMQSSRVKTKCLIITTAHNLHCLQFIQYHMGVNISVSIIPSLSLYKLELFFSYLRNSIGRKTLATWSGKKANHSSLMIFLMKKWIVSIYIYISISLSSSLLVYGWDR